MNGRGNNNVPETSGKFHSFRLPKGIILRGDKNFQQLFEHGISLRGSCLDLKFIVMPSNNNLKSVTDSDISKVTLDETAQCKMGFIVGKRLGKAAKRNRLRRQIKEAYRLNRDLVPCQPVWHAAFIAKKIDVPYAVINTDCVSLLKQLGHRLQTCKPETQ